MAKQQKNFVGRLADAGEETIQRLGGAPGADKVSGAFNSLKTRVDELQKSVRTIDKLERRLTAIEHRLDKLEGKGRSSTSSKKTSASSSSKTSSSSSSRKT
jgi:hypothetical protein